MGAKYTPGQKKATEKYMQEKRMLHIVVSKETAEKYKKEAEARGISLNRFIINCIETQINN